MTQSADAITSANLNVDLQNLQTGTCFQPGTLGDSIPASGRSSNTQLANQNCGRRSGLHTNYFWNDMGRGVAHPMAPGDVLSADDFDHNDLAFSMTCDATKPHRVHLLRMLPSPIRSRRVQRAGPGLDRQMRRVT